MSRFRVISDRIESASCPVILADGEVMILWLRTDALGEAHDAG